MWRGCQGRVTGPWLATARIPAPEAAPVSRRPCRGLTFLYPHARARALLFLSFFLYVDTGIQFLRRGPVDTGIQSQRYLNIHIHVLEASPNSRRA